MVATGGCGGPSTNMATFWMYWCRAGATARRLNNRAENSHQPTRVREKGMRRFKSACHLQRFVSVHDQVDNTVVRQ
jgi:transposase-like protein